MNHLPDGRWQFVLEMPNADRQRVYRAESTEALNLTIEPDAPHSRATWIVDAARVQTQEPFYLKLWVDGDDFPVQVHFPRGGKDYGREGVTTLVILSLLPRR